MRVSPAVSLSERGLDRERAFYPERVARRRPLQAENLILPLPIRDCFRSAGPSHDLRAEGGRY
jgi:hypothetical protein